MDAWAFGLAAFSVVFSGILGFGSAYFVSSKQRQWEKQDERRREHQAILEEINDIVTRLLAISLRVPFIASRLNLSIRHLCGFDLPAAFIEAISLSLRAASLSRSIDDKPLKESIEALANTLRKGLTENESNNFSAWQTTIQSKSRQVLQRVDELSARPIGPPKRQRRWRRMAQN